MTVPAAQATSCAFAAAELSRLYSEVAGVGARVVGKELDEKTIAPCDPGKRARTATSPVGRRLVTGSFESARPEILRAPKPTS
jgi:hypothetical protein